MILGDILRENFKICAYHFFSRWPPAHLGFSYPACSQMASSANLFLVANSQAGQKVYFFFILCTVSSQLGLARLAGLAVPLQCFHLSNFPLRVST